MRIQIFQVGGWRPVRASQMAKNSPASPRVARRGTARPAENRFIQPPWRPNIEILPQSAGPNNPESRSGAYRGTRTITIPPCRRAFLPQNTQNPASPDTEGGWEKMSSRHFNHNPVTGEGRAPSRPLASPHVHFSHRSGIGLARDVPAPPSARGVRTREGHNVLRPREGTDAWTQATIRRRM